MRQTEGAGRVVSVLELLGGSPRPMAVGEVALSLAVHPSTASRLLATLEKRRFVERDRLGRYLLGTHIVGLAAAAIAVMPVVSQVRPELERLAALASETTNLAILDGRHVVYVDQVMPAQTVVMASWVGRRSPVHASSSGKVLVAFGDPRMREAILHGRLERLTPRTVTDPKRLKAMLARVRRQGFAAGIGELEDGMVTMAAPILVEGRAVAAISLAGPSSRLPERDLPRLAPLLLDAAAAATHRISGKH